MKHKIMRKMVFWQLKSFRKREKSYGTLEPFV